MNDAQTAGIIALHSYSYMAPAWRRHQTAPPADADAVPAAASSLASAVLLPMQAWVTAGVHGLGLLEQSAIDTLKEALFAEGCSWGGSRGGALGRDHHGGGGAGGERLPVAVAETLRGMSLGDMMEEEREEVVDVAVVEGEGETAVEVAAAEEAAASATKAEVEVGVTVKTEAEAEPEEDWFYRLESGRVVGPVGWAELLCAAREGVLLPSSLTRHGQHLWRHAQRAWRPSSCQTCHRRRRRTALKSKRRVV